MGVTIAYILIPLVCATLTALPLASIHPVALAVVVLDLRDQPGQRAPQQNMQPAREDVRCAAVAQPLGSPADPVPVGAVDQQLHDIGAEADGHHESARNAWKGTVTSIDAVNHGIGTASHVVVTVSIGQVHIIASITANSALTLGLEVGMAVECVVKALNKNVSIIKILKNFFINIIPSLF